MSGTVGDRARAAKLAGRIKVPAPTRQAIFDVLSMRALGRVISALRRNAPGRDADGRDFDRALARVINLNGAMARVVEHGRR